MTELDILQAEVESESKQRQQASFTFLQKARGLHELTTMSALTNMHKISRSILVPGAL